MARLLDLLPVPTGDAVLDLLPRLARAGRRRPGAAAGAGGDPPPPRHAGRRRRRRRRPARVRGGHLRARPAPQARAAAASRAPARLGRPPSAAVGGTRALAARAARQHIAGLRCCSGRRWRAARRRAGHRTAVHRELHRGAGDPPAGAGSSRWCRPSCTGCWPIRGDDALASSTRSWSAGPRSAGAARGRRGGGPVVTTYGMSETCGGCVYDGRPLDGVTVDLESTAGSDPRAGGRPRLSRTPAGAPFGRAAHRRAHVPHRRPRLASLTTAG